MLKNLEVGKMPTSRFWIMGLIVLLIAISIVTRQFWVCS